MEITPFCVAPSKVAKASEKSVAYADIFVYKLCQYTCCGLTMEHLDIAHLNGAFKLVKFIVKTSTKTSIIMMQS